MIIRVHVLILTTDTYFLNLCIDTTVSTSEIEFYQPLFMYCQVRLLLQSTLIEK